MFYALFWHKHFDAHFTLIFSFIPVTNLGYMLVAQSVSLEEALAANKFIYIGGCYLVLLFMLSILSLCHIRVSKLMKLLFFSISTAIYVCILTDGHHSFYYKTIGFERVNGAGTLTKEYGLGHTLFYAMLILYFIISISAITYSFFRKKDVSNRIIYLLLLPAMISFISYFGGKISPEAMDLLPLTYVLAQVVYLIIIDRVCIYDVTNTCGDSLIQNGDTGLLSFDFNSYFLGCNETARKFIPAVAELSIDKPVSDDLRGRRKDTQYRYRLPLRRTPPQRLSAPYNGRYSESGVYLAYQPLQ